MDQMLQLQDAIVGIVGSVIGWAALIALLLIARNFIITALARALVPVLRDADGTTQRLIIKYLVNRPMTLDELYQDMKAEADGTGMSNPDKPEDGER